MKFKKFKKSVSMLLVFAFVVGIAGSTLTVPTEAIGNMIIMYNTNIRGLGWGWGWATEPNTSGMTDHSRYMEQFRATLGGVLIPGGARLGYSAHKIGRAHV